MTHLDPDRLADRALGTDDPRTAAEQKHLDSCTECRNELAQLSRIAELSRHPEELAQVPADAIWRSIQVQLASQAPAPVRTELAPEPPPSPPTVSQLPRRTPRPRSWLLVAAAAVVGLIIGVGVTTVPGRDRVEVTSSTALEALPGQTGQGTAELVSDRGRPELRVQIDAPPTPDRYREVWLINTDGQRMYPLGVLPDDGSATYPLPPALAGQLQGFTIVDVSIEPYDGNPAHSRESQVRGILPT
ncbi:MAG TPA: anti-sigma factor [Propionibacteriaceae bacterium]|nr:anti-sigma factor [Propionibacteriaceae bacterium]